MTGMKKRETHTGGGGISEQGGPCDYWSLK